MCLEQEKCCEATEHSSVGLQPFGSCHCANDSVLTAPRLMCPLCCLHDKTNQQAHTVHMESPQTQRQTIRVQLVLRRCLPLTNSEIIRALTLRSRRFTRQGG